jgi:hypothetical protein
LAGDAFRQAEDSVLRVPGAFTRPLATIGGRPLTLTEIEHGKIRRFGDPRIHGALVCGRTTRPTDAAISSRGRGLPGRPHTAFEPGAAVVWSRLRAAPSHADSAAGW